MRDTQWGELIQLAGVLVLGFGCACEVIYQAHIFLVIITVGSVMFAIGTKLKHRGD